MISNARAQRLIDKFEEGAAFAGGHSVRHGLAAVLRHLADVETIYAYWEGFNAIPSCILEGLANSLEAPTFLLERAMKGDAAAARQFLHEGGFTDAEGNLLPHLRSAEEGQA